MTHKKAFDKYSEVLVKCLLINDTLFIAKLSTFSLLPINTNNQLEALPIHMMVRHFACQTMCLSQLLASI